MIEHLLLSTLVLALAVAAARVLPLTARTRHALLLAGLAKFLLPSSLFRAFGIEPAIAMPPALRVFAGAPAAAQIPQQETNWMAIAWTAFALLIFARWLLLRARTIDAALRAAAPASPREIKARDDARRALSITTAIDVVRSPICEAPAVLRIIRPVIVLPANGCDALDDDELRSLLLHECAHVARRDNLVSTFEALAGAILFFNPLVWLALRDLGVTREEACDETVTDAMQQPEAYVTALTKVCRAALAPRTAGASCMASARLKERMNHLMNYEPLKKRAFSHRAALATAIVTILAITSGASAIDTDRKEGLRQIYKLNFTVTPVPRGNLFEIEVIERETGRVVSSPRVNTQLGVLATITSEDGPRTIELRALPHRDGTSKVFIEVKENGKTVQRNLYMHSPDAAPPSGQYNGEPISISLKDAEVKDVLKTFGQLTGYRVAVDPGIEGRITIDAKDRPWDEVLDRIANEHGLKITVENGLMIVTRR